MPTIANPYRRGAGSTADPHDPATGRGSTRSLRSRLHTVWHRTAITRALADGADPATDPQLSLRAAQLTSRGNRRALAKTLRRIVDDAHRPPMVGFRVILIRRRPVIDAEDLVVALSERLVAPAPVRAQGMARLERILSNADHSPLYNDREPGALSAVLAAAREALDHQPTAPSHEFPLRG